MNKNLNPFKLGPRIGRSVPTEYFILANLQSEGTTIGHLAGRPIPETVVDASGHCYRFAGVAPRDADGRFNIDSLRAGEWIVQPGLVYLMEESARAQRV
jgi:hypothetical protein